MQLAAVFAYPEALWQTKNLKHLFSTTPGFLSQESGDQ